MNKSCSPKH